MGLSDDQKAMLRLLAQREEGYEDMAKLMGISVDALRARVREALAEVETPPAAADSSTQPAEETEPERPAAAVSTSAPTASAPVPIPREAEERASSAANPTPRAPRGDRSRAQIPRLSLPKDRGALIGLGAGALAVIVLIIVLIVGGGDDSGSITAGGGNQDAELTAEERNLTQAVLVPTGAADASGRALFGRYKRNVLLQVEADGLEPSPPGSSYTVWLYRSPKLALQIGAVRVGDSGKLAAQFQIPAQLLTYVANGSFDQVDVSLTPIAEYKAAFSRAKSQNEVPPYVGESVLRGEITGPAIR